MLGERGTHLTSIALRLSWYERAPSIAGFAGDAGEPGERERRNEVESTFVICEVIETSKLSLL